MKRLFSGLLATAFLLSSAMLTASAASHSSMTSSHSKTKQTCPAGEKWVKGYKTKSGKTVKGYCRKSTTKM
jgi:hypothetical protein